MRSEGGASITSSMAARAETGRHYNAVGEFGDELGCASPRLRHIRIVEESIDRFANALPRLAIARERWLIMILADTVDLLSEFWMR